MVGRRTPARSPSPTPSWSGDDSSSSEDELDNDYFMKNKVAIVEHICDALLRNPLVPNPTSSSVDNTDYSQAMYGGVLPMVSNETQTFKFNNLAPELRLAIWSYAVTDLGPRVTGIYATDRTATLSNHWRRIFVPSP